MPDFGDGVCTVGYPTHGVISPWDTHQDLGAALKLGRIIGATAVWSAANTAFFLPFTVEDEVTITQMGTWNGTAVSGNIDVGIYDLLGNRLTSAGSTVQAGTSTIQVFNVADVTLKPGYYLQAIALDNIVGTNFRGSPDVSILEAVGVRANTAAFPLPATVTLNVHTASNYCPNVCAYTRSQTV